MGLATEELAAKSGPGIGGLLNVTFGNAPELIIALIALNAGLQEVVKASIVGSIIGNILLVLGASMLVGGLKHERQTLQPAGGQHPGDDAVPRRRSAGHARDLRAGRGPGPAQPDAAEAVDFDSTVEKLSLATAIVLIGTYLLGLLFSLQHSQGPVQPAVRRGARGGLRLERAPLGDATSSSPGLAVGLMSEVLVGSISEASESIGLSEFFVGVIVVAIVGNAAEHWVAILVAYKNKMDLAVNIAIGSSAQIALFVAPVLVIASFFIGVGPMPLVFNGFELGAILLAILVANVITQDGESNWFEGVQLLALYAILGIAFFYA